MGWSFSPDWSRKGLVEYLTKPDKKTNNIIKNLFVGNHLWCVYEGVHKNNTIRYIVLYLLQSGGSDGGWGYKVIDECSGPTAEDCPVRLLYMCTAPENKTAYAWRQRIYAANRKLKSIRVGDYFTFNGADYQVAKITTGARYSFTVSDMKEVPTYYRMKEACILQAEMWS